MTVDPFPVYPGAIPSTVPVNGSVVMPAGTREVAGTVVAFGAGPADSATPIYVPLGTSVTWGYTSGVNPQIGTLRLQRPWVEQIVAAINSSSDKALRLTIGGQPIAKNRLSSEDQTGLDVTYERLSLLPSVSGDYAHDTLTWADRRYWWNRRTVTKSYNIVRMTTDNFIYGNLSGSRPRGGLALSRALKYFAEWSVDTQAGVKKPWTAISIVYDILRFQINVAQSDIVFLSDVIGASDLAGAQILTHQAAAGASGGSAAGATPWAGQSPGTISIVGNTGNTSPEVAYIPTNVQIMGEPADAVLARFLKMAGADLYIGADGKIYIYSTITQDAAAQGQTFTNELSNWLTSGALNMVDFSSIRPRRVVSQFEVEREMMFAYQEGVTIGTNTAKVATTQAEAQAQINNRVIYVENVTRAVVNDQVQGYPRGSYIPITAALAGFGTKYGSGPISLDKFRNHWGQTGIPAFALAMGDANTQGFIDPLAVQVWNQIRSDYRTLFRVPAVVMERIKDVKTLTAGVVFPETGLRAPAEVFGQVTWIADAVTPLVDWDSNGIELNSKRATPYIPIPADVASFSVDEGVMAITFRDNLNHPGLLRAIIPGTVRDDLAALMKKDGWPNGYIAAGDGLMASFIGDYALSPQYAMQAIMSVVVQPIPGAQTSIEEFGIAASATGLGIGDGYAPDMYLPVSRVDTVRYSIPGTGETAQYKNPQAPQGELAVNREVIDAVAKEEAKRVYYTFVNSIEGSANYAWATPTVALRPGGHIRNIRHTVSTDGKLNVSVAAPQWKTPLELYNMLPADILRHTEKQIAATAIGVRGGV